MVLFFAGLYTLIGVASAEFAREAASVQMQEMWRRLAWLVSGVAFAAHIAYGHFRLGNRPRTTAIEASIAAGIGAGGLAAAANVHEWMTRSAYRPSMAIALIAWPLLTAIPAFIVAMVTAMLLARRRRT